MRAAHLPGETEKRDPSLPDGEKGRPPEGPAPVPTSLKAGRMSIKAKVMVFLLGVFMLYGILDYGVQRFIVFPQFEDLERREAQENLQRSLYAIEREVEHINSVCHDWAAWDDTYHFVQDRSRAYVESNLGLSAFNDLQMNLIIICDLQGRVVWQRIYDLQSGKALKIASFPEDILPAGHPLIQFDFKGKDLADASVSGVISTERGPLLIASRPILKSGNLGPVKGYFLMGKFLTPDFASRLALQTRVKFTISSDREEISTLLKEARDTIGERFPYAIHYTGKDQLAILATYPDIRGMQAFLIRSTIDRDIVRSGHEAMRYALMTLVAAGLCIVIIILLLMDRTLLSPVVKLTRHVLSIRETGNFSVRLSVHRSDEVGTLAREFDRMLDKIEEMNTVMEHINDQLIDDIVKKQEMEDKLQAANRQLELLASVDGLTRLSNRRKFDEYFDVEWKRGLRSREPLSLIIFDVDFFKLFNDTYGHQAGDDCLRAVASVIGSHVQRVADLAARYGGEEFALILPSTDLQGAMHLAESIRTEVQKLKISHSRSQVAEHVTLSAGVACSVPGRESSVDKLIWMADKALYEAKGKGRNRSVMQKNS